MPRDDSDSLWLCEQHAGMIKNTKKLKGFSVTSKFRSPIIAGTEYCRAVVLAISTSTDHARIMVCFLNIFTEISSSRWMLNKTVYKNVNKDF